MYFRHVQPKLAIEISNMKCSVRYFIQANCLLHISGPCSLDANSSHTLSPTVTEQSGHITFNQLGDHNRSNDKGRICVITTDDVSRGADMPSFITIALVIDKECNTPTAG